MASGFIASNDLDLDSIFAPYVAGWPQAPATGYASGGDLNSRYAPLSTGAAAAPTGFKVSSGADLNTLFAASGTTSVQVATQPSGVSGSAAAGVPSGVVTSNSTTCAGTKGKGSYTYTWHFASGSGATFTAGNFPTTAVTGNVPAGATLSGTMYCTISDGTTSINTNTVAWSLTNTTPATITFNMLAAKGPGAFSAETGFQQATFGQVTGVSGLDAGLSIFALFFSSTTGQTVFEIQGFTADPGPSFFTSIIANGVTNTSAARASYVFDPSTGRAEWGWTIPNGFNFSPGVNYPVTVNR